MAYESDEDFTTPPVSKRRKTRLLGNKRFQKTDAVPLKQVGLEHKEDDCRKKTGQERERNQNMVLQKELPLFENASCLEKKDVLFVLELETSKSEGATCSDIGRSTEDMALEMRKREILDMMRKRKKSKERTFEEMKSIKKMVTGEFEQHRVMVVLLALKGKRRCGEPLPTPEELASYVFKKTKGKVTSTVEQTTARAMLKHVVLSYPMKGGGRESLTGILKGLLETEDI